MPLIRIEKINDSSWIGMWRVEEEIGWFFREVDLSIEEPDAVGNISNHYKKLEWLSTRTLLQALTLKIGVPYPGIIKDDHGKPFLKNYSHPISITHSFPFVSAIIHKDKEVGIDLEKLKINKILRIAPKFMNSKEYAFSRNDSHISTLIWCAKESLYKLHGRKFVIFKEDLEIEPFEIAGSGQLIGHIKLPDLNASFTMNYEITDEYYTTYTVR
jgi:4'-phosphopantetheinyl transferase